MNQITLLDAIQITGVCMGIVFLALIAIMILLEVMGKVLSNVSAQKQVQGVTPMVNNHRHVVEEVRFDKEEEMLIAMTVCADATEGQDGMKAKVRSFKQIG